MSNAEELDVGEESITFGDTTIWPLLHRILLCVLQLLATTCITFLHAMAFTASENSNFGWTQSSNDSILRSLVRQLNDGMTKDILCLAIRPASLLNISLALFSMENPVGSSYVKTILSSSHFVTVLILSFWHGGSDGYPSTLTSPSFSHAVASSLSWSSSSSFASLCSSSGLWVVFLM